MLIGKVGCVLSSTANWQFQPLLIHSMRVNVTDLFVLDGINVPLVIPIPTLESCQPRGANAPGNGH